MITTAFRARHLTSQTLILQGFYPRRSAPEWGDGPFRFGACHRSGRTVFVSRDISLGNAPAGGVDRAIELGTVTGLRSGAGVLYESFHAHDQMR